MTDTGVQRPWVILAFLCIPVFVGALDLTIVSAILPEVLVSLNLPLESRLDDATWMITGYLLAYTISVAFTGQLSDIIGRRRVYIIYLLVFLFGSYFVANAHTWPVDIYARIYRFIFPDDRPPSLEIRTLHMIILGRVIQAIGAGAMPPITIAMVADLFASNSRARPIAVVGAVDTVGWVLGHLYGGLMVNFFGHNGEAIADAFASIGLEVGVPTWRTLFMINILFGAITLVALWYGLRGVTQVRARQPFDIVGTILIVLSLLFLTLGLGGNSPETATHLAEDTLEQGSSVLWPLLIASLIAFLGFLAVEAFGTKYPLVNLNLFKNPNVSASSIANVCMGFALTIGLVAIPLLVNFRASDTSAKGIQEAAMIAGLLLSGLTIPMAIAAIPGSWLSDTKGYRYATVAGLGLAIIGFMLAATTWRVDTHYLIMAGQMALVGIGLGLTISPIAAAVVNTAKASERGAASALVLALRLVGMTLALSSLTNFAIAQVNKRVAESGTAGMDAEQTADLYLEKIVEVVDELFLIGAAVCLLGLIAALWLKGGAFNDMVEQPDSVDIPTAEPFHQSQA